MRSCKRTRIVRLSNMGTKSGRRLAASLTSIEAPFSRVRLSPFLTFMYLYRCRCESERLPVLYICRDLCIGYMIRDVNKKRRRGPNSPENGSCSTTCRTQVCSRRTTKGAGGRVGTHDPTLKSETRNQNVGSVVKDSRELLENRLFVIHLLRSLR